MDLSDLIPSVRPLAFIPHIRDLTIAYVLALPIGWNREHEAHSAGVRTFPLVAIAACGFVQATEQILAGHPDAASRIIAGVITGIGFIGGGAILKGSGEVHGTATAASLWATGAIGISVAVGQYDVAVVVCLFTAATLFVLGRLKRRARG
jgi:putative Mg2+ transporter-C (MgtC) family protein